MSRTLLIAFALAAGCGAPANVELGVQPATPRLGSVAPAKSVALGPSRPSPVSLQTHAQR